MNVVCLMGRLTKDPEIRFAGETKVANYTLAVNKAFKRQGEPDADFIRCIVFAKGADFAEKYLSKGMQIAVTGRLQVRLWEDKNGVKRETSEVVVERQHFAEGKKVDAAPKQEQGFYPIDTSIEEDDLPF